MHSQHDAKPMRIQWPGLYLLLLVHYFVNSCACELMRGLSNFNDFPGSIEHR